MEGVPFDGVDDSHLFAQFVSLRTLLASIGKTYGKRLAVWGTLQRTKINFDRDYRFDSEFCQRFADKYLKRFQNQEYYENVYHLSAVLKDDRLDAGIKEAEALRDEIEEFDDNHAYSVSFFAFKDPESVIKKYEYTRYYRIQSGQTRH